MTAELDSVVLHHIVNSLGWPALRPLQEAAVEPVVAGDDALLLAPTAGGKTEAAVFAILTAMTQQRWRGLSVLYVCPLKALLNNLLPRLEQYTAWTGRRVALWHGDVSSAARRAILHDLPDILLTTPESLEAMLVSENVDHRRAFADLRVVVVDEVHAFASDDRGWHLLAVLERLSRIAGHPLQRVGLSATVGNPEELLAWLQGSSRGSRRARVVAPHLESAPRPAVPQQAPSARDGAAPAPSGAGATSTAVVTAEVELDYVGSVANAATVIAALHRGEKRLVFCDSRRLVEELGAALLQRQITTFLSHASLSLDERQTAERAFAEARDCVIVSTSTLELGIDVGDLDRVIQLDSPPTVASFLQRIGRTGRRSGGTRNALLLCLTRDSLLRAAGLLMLWARGYVEPVVPPPEPRHIVAQQILALCLQEHRIGRGEWSAQWNGLAPFDDSGEPILAHLLTQGFLDADGDLLFVGPTAEAKYGYRHFSDLTAVFTAAPQFLVLAGRQEIGQVDPMLLTQHAEGARLLLLAGRSWKVTWVDWKRRRCQVEPAEAGGRARWVTTGAGGDQYAMTRAARDVLLGSDPPVALTARAVCALAEIRHDLGHVADPAGTVIERGDDDVRWWTWAGYRTNATLAATLPDVVDGARRFDDRSLRLRSDLTRDLWSAATSDAASRVCLPAVDGKAVAGLKFTEALPQRLAEITLATRLADVEHAAAVLAEPTRMIIPPA